MKVQVLLPAFVISLFLTACASSHNVAHTLDKYQPGVTTWNDFTKDANVTQERPGPQALQARYLDSSAPPTIKVWVAQRDPWRIYEQRETVSTDKTEVVVGDTHHPLALLTFKGDTLTDKRQLR
jgi:hypothetical protein